MKKLKRIAFLFPGQGAQYPGMAQDFYENFSCARMTFEEADDLLGDSLSKIILNGPADVLTETHHSQVGIYVTSLAILRVLQELYEIKPHICAGLSLGEYSALTAAGYLSFSQALPLVKKRGLFMSQACEMTKGTMAVVMGLEADIVEKCVKDVNLPDDLWVANYNCPGQIVISGTQKGIAAGTEALKAHHAKRILPLQVHGAFHSGLMKSAQDKLAPFIYETAFQKGNAKVVMNVTGTFVDSLEEIQNLLVKQVTHSVKWEQGIRAIEEQGVDLYIEFGPGKSLSGMNKRIGVQSPTLSIEKVEDLQQLVER